MHYYQFHITDFAYHTSHLSLEEDAVYRRLLDFYYDSEAPIPKETQSVIRRLRLVNYEAIADRILQEFFVLTDDGWHNSRADKEIIAYHSKAEVARVNGKKGGRPKKNNDLGDSITQSVILANPDITQTKANQEPRTINQEPRTINQEPRTINDKVKTIVPSGDDTSASDDAMSVFNYWKIATGKSKAKLNSTIRGKILTRLKAYSVSDLLQAIDGNQASKFHQGENDEKRKYDSLDLICRNDENVRKFVEMADHQNTVNRDLEDWVNE